MTKEKIQLTWVIIKFGVIVVGLAILAYKNIIA